MVATLGLLAATHTALYNLLGFPAGTVAAARPRELGVPGLLAPGARRAATPILAAAALLVVLASRGRR